MVLNRREVNLPTLYEIVINWGFKIIHHISPLPLKQVPIYHITRIHMENSTLMFKLKSTTKVALIGDLTTLTIFSQIKADLRHNKYLKLG